VTSVERPADFLQRHDPALLLCTGALAAMVIAGVAFLITGAATGSGHTSANGGYWLFAAFFMGVPGWLGWWLATRRRKIRVEKQLEDVQDRLEHAVELLEGRTGVSPLAVVRDFPPR
jgi:hypothetical protein